MPRTIDVIRERNIDPGRYASPAVTPLPAEKRVRVNLVSSEWDTASAQTIRIGLERSFDDGATWQLWASIVTNPGRRDKNGAMPWISVPLYAGETYQARAFAEVEQRISLGATVETSDGTRIVLNPPQEPHSWADTGRKNETAGGGGNQVQIALNSTAAGSLIAVCGTYWSTSGANSISASDSVNGVYSEAFDSYYSDLGCGLDFHPNNAGGNLTVYVDTSGESNSFWAAVHEFSGGVTVNPLSGTPDTNTGSGVTLTAGPMTPADNDVLLLSAGVVDIQGTIAENAGSEGFTLSNELEGAWETSSFVFKIISGAPGTPSHSWTAGGSSTWTAGIAAFKPLGGGTYSPTKDAAYRVLTTQSPTKTAAYGILTTQSPTKTAEYRIQNQGVVRVGDIVEHNVETGNISITVPDGATIAIASMGVPAAHNANSVLKLDGQTFQLLDGIAYANGVNGCIQVKYCTGFSTGANKSLEISAAMWSTGSGHKWILQFFSGATQIRDFTSNIGPIPYVDDKTIESAAIDVVDGDYACVAGFGYTDSEDASVGSQTQDYNTNNAGITDHAFGHKIASATGTTTMQFNGKYPSMVAWSFLPTRSLTKNASYSIQKLWKKGFNFRATSGFVSDGTYETYDLGGIYPVNRNDATFGWDEDRSTQTRDRYAGGIPELAGICFQGNGSFPRVWRCDLPRAGNYKINIACGDHDNEQQQYIEIGDNGSYTVIGSGVVTSADSYMDADGTVLSAANWPNNNTQIVKNFTSTVFQIRIANGGSSQNSTLTHVTIEEVGPAKDATYRVQNTQSPTKTAVYDVTALTTKYFGMCDEDTGAITGDTNDDGVGGGITSFWDGTRTYTCPGTGTVPLTALELYCRVVGSGVVARIGVYLASDGSKVGEGSTSFQPTGASYSWQGHTGLNINLTGGEVYKFFCGANGHGTGNLEFRAALGASGIGRYDTNTDYSEGCPATLPSGTPNDLCQAFRGTVGIETLELPIVTTQAASNIDTSSATLNGNITSTGGENCDTRGFVWGTTSHVDPGNVAPASAGYDHYSSSSGSYGTGAYTDSVSSLEAYPQLLYARAWAHNSTGYDYGDEVSFRCDQALPNNSYSTDLALTENPISEGDVWLNGDTDGLDWLNCRTNGTMVYGDGVNAGYDDPTSILKGTWSNNQWARGTVHITEQPSSGFAEVELRIRSSISAHVNNGYEILFNARPSVGYYIQLVRWNGPLGTGEGDGFDGIDGSTFPAALGRDYVIDGDVIYIEVIGNIIKASINDIWLVWSSTSTTEHDITNDSPPTDDSGGPAYYTGGYPGVGFYDGNSGNLSKIGFSHFEAGEIITQVTLDQSAVRWRNDDGDEANATWAADENAQLTGDSGAKRIRVQINNTGDPAAITPQFDWRRKPSGGSFGPWSKVN